MEIRMLLSRVILRFTFRIDIRFWRKTNLADEYLTLANDILRIKKVYDCSKSKVSSTVYIVANHPNTVDAENLLSLKERICKNH